MTASASKTAPPNPKPERTNPQQLDRPTQRGTYLQSGSILDENPGSVLSGNQHPAVIQRKSGVLRNGAPFAELPVALTDENGSSRSPDACAQRVIAAIENYQCTTL